MDKVFFDNNDGVLLAVIKIFNGKKLSMKDIIMTGNTIDHSILSLEDINNGISKLVSEDFIRLKDSHVYLMKKAIDFFQSNKRKFKGVIDEQVHYSTSLSLIQLRNSIAYKEYFNNDLYNKVVSKL